MPIKVTLEDGSETEAYTSEELKSQQEAAVEAYKQSNPDKKEEMDALQSDLKKANDELEKMKGKEFNFGELRKQKEAAEGKVTDLKKEMDEKLETVKKEVFEGVLKDHYTEILNSLIDGDEELKKKIEFHYKRLQDSAITKSEITKKLTDAWILATKPDNPGALNSAVLSSGNGSKLKIKSNQPFSPDEKALAQKLASAGGLKLEDKDFN